MRFDEYLRELKARLDGDAFVRLLKANLASGHQIQKVSFLPAEPGKPERYRFLLARLGTLSDVDVPAGSEAIERLLAERRLKLASEEEEVQRSALRFRRSLAAWRKAKSYEELRAAVARFSRRAGALASLAESQGGQHLTLDREALLLEEEVARAFDTQIASLHLDSGYDLEAAGAVVDRGLAQFIQSQNPLPGAD